ATSVYGSDFSSLVLSGRNTRWHAPLTERRQKRFVRNTDLWLHSVGRSLADELARSRDGNADFAGRRPTHYRRRSSADAADYQAQLGFRASPHFPGFQILRIFV